MNKTKYYKKYVKHYNYSGGIRCNDIKPIERKFFRYLIRQIDYEKTTQLDRDMAIIRDSVRYHANKFSNKYNAPYKQLMYYLDKWSDKGIYNYGVTLDLGWFENISKMMGIVTSANQSETDRISIYRDMVPQRVKRLCFRNLKIKEAK